MTTYRFAITGLRHHDFANRLDELYDKAKMSQGQVNDIKNNAQFLGFKNDRGVIPLCYDFPCKFIKIKWELRRCWLKKLYSSLFSLARPLSKNDTGGQNGPCFCFPQTVICYLLSVPQKTHFWKLSTVNCNAKMKSEVWGLKSEGVVFIILRKSFSVSSVWSVDFFG